MKNRFVFLLFVLVVFVFGGCANQKSEKESKDEITVITSFYPVYSLVSSVSKGAKGVNVINMSQPQTGCLHDYQMTSGDMKLLSTGDVLFINGGGMEAFLNDAVSLFEDLKIIDTSSGAQFICFESEHEKEHNHDHEEAFNSHIWLLASNALIQAQNIKNALCEIDPAQKEIYEKNTLAFQNELKQLQEQIPQNKQTVKAAIFHEGFDYFEAQYDIKIQFGIFVDENEQPTPKELAEAIRTVKEQNIKLLLAADDGGKTIAQIISNETDARMVILDPMTWADGTPDYIKTMKQNNMILQEAIAYAYP